tara:strand:+ start:411 stop:917 length:507 start_codon:yes stop_codon:yes gene_type:complete
MAVRPNRPPAGRAIGTKKSQPNRLKSKGKDPFHNRRETRRFFYNLTAKAENSEKVPQWKKTLETQGSINLVYSASDFPFAPLYSKVLRGLYTDKGDIDTQNLIWELQSKKFGIFGAPAYEKVFPQGSPLNGYKITAYKAIGYDPPGFLLLGLLFSSGQSNIKIKLEKA